MNIAIVDEQLMFSDTLKVALENAFSLADVKTFIRPSDFLALDFQQWRPDLVIVDILMQEMNGMELIDKVMPVLKPHSKFICVSQPSDMSVIRSAIRSGINGFVSKDSSFSELLLAIRTVNDGGQYLSQQVRDDLFNFMLRPTVLEVYNLTSKEVLVLQGLCDGSTIKEIADNIKLSPHTVKLYKGSILRKFNKHRTIDVISFVLTHGLYRKK